MGIARLDPVQGGEDLFEGVGSGVQVAADAASAVNNAVINPAPPGDGRSRRCARTADTAGHVTGAVTQTWAQNLPGSERTGDALNPMSLWYHDRAFKPTAYTRTDTQLNIDRLVSIANILGVWALASSGGDGGSDTFGDGGGSGGSPGSPVPSSSPPSGGPGPFSIPPCARAADSSVGALRHRYAAARVEVVMAVRDSTGVRAAALLAALIGCGEREAAPPTDPACRAARARRTRRKPAALPSRARRDPTWRCRRRRSPRGLVRAPA